MNLNWFDAREAKDAGIKLAEFFAERFPNNQSTSKQARNLQYMLTRALQIKQELNLNVYKKAQLCNSFKWKLLEYGYDDDLVNELTREILLALN